jgi:predicted ribosomally synthesized peptide with SipW-like signal peptide
LARFSTLASLLAVLAGSYAFYTNSESYNNSFSSIGKAFQGDNIADVFTPRSINAREDAVRVKKMKVRLYKDGSGEHFYVAGDET